MASYTIELRKVCNIYGQDEVEKWFKSYNLEDYLTPNQIEVLNKNNIWSKDKLAKKIVNHYFMREIGFETPTLFKHYALITMEEIMEEYLPLIYSKAIEFEPLVNVDFTETFIRSIEGTGENSGTSTSSSNSVTGSMNILSNTPQTRITKQLLDNGIYASQTNQTDNITDINDDTSTNNKTSSNSQENYTKTTKGNSGVSATAQNMIKQFRDITRAFDKEIIEKLSSLFIGLY